MKLIRAFNLAATALFALSSAASAQKVSIVATTPDLASLAQLIGGTSVDVKVLAKPTEDPHFVDAKPSHIITLNRADMLIEGGAELEVGWLPPLLESARNSKIAPGARGRVVASQRVKMLEIPTSFDRSRGDVHSMGNPHFLLDPVNARVIAAHIAEHLTQVNSGSAALYQANLLAFNTRLDAKLTEWQRQLAPYKGAKIVTYHKDFAYLADRFGLTVIQTLEPKPGIAPSPTHLAKVISDMKAQNSRVILVQPYQNRKTAEMVARQTDGVVLDLPQQPGAVRNTATYFDLMDHIVGSLVRAFQGSAAR